MGEVFRLSISFLVVSVLAGLPCGAQTDSLPRIFRPAANSMVEPGPLSVVARGSAAASLMLDGTPIAVTRPGPQALTTTVTPSAGRHELVLRDGDAEVRVAFFVGVFSSTAQPQDEWKAFRSHPPPATGATCSACHAVRDGKWESAGGGIASNCFRCHNAELFPKAHTHERGVLADCTMCHLAHGSTESKHLKMTAKAACTQCHF